MKFAYKVPAHNLSSAVVLLFVLFTLVNFYSLFGLLSVF